ncbi:MAG TPA: response regulator [Gaiellaceae bacterium]|jgi:two-component system, OmpR family, KDP operon response regulator KdpE|nr:response regulator [Gaiellaceae bacterium]
MPKILVIEDDVDISRLIGMQLKAGGYEAAYASDAVTAMTVARKERPDLILLDLGLPGGGGILVLERLRAIAELAATPVIVVTARTDAAGEQAARAAGAVDFLRKPVEADDLAAAIERALG